MTKFPKTQPMPSVRQASSPSPKRKSGLGWLGTILLLAVIAGLLYYFQPWTAFTSSSATPTSASHGGKGGGRGLPPVAVAKSTRGDMPIYLNGLGSVVPLNTVTAKTRVDGQLMKINFTEGQMVNAGDLLVQIDARPYEVALEQAQAQLQHDQAVLQNAQVDLARYQKLWAQDSIPQQTLATQQALVLQNEGTVQGDQAQVDNAKLNLVYCNITSPIAGRLGLRQVDVGNMVHASDTTGLVVITQLQPISVIFTIPQDVIPSVVTKLNAGETLEVDALDRDLKKKLAVGTLTTVDNQIDPTTLTLKCRAQFLNPDSSLFPNQFVNARLRVETHKDVVLVPNAAIQTGQKGTFVYTLDEQNSVSLKPVTIGVTDGTNTELTGGLEAGETVVTDGVDKLQEGSKVKVQGPSTDGTPSPDAPAPTGQHKHHHASGTDGATPPTPPQA